MRTEIGGADGRQPLGSVPIRSPLAAASRRSPRLFGEMLATEP